MHDMNQVMDAKILTTACSRWPILLSCTRGEVGGRALTKSVTKRQTSIIEHSVQVMLGSSFTTILQQYGSR